MSAGAFLVGLLAAGLASPGGRDAGALRHAVETRLVAVEEGGGEEDRRALLAALEVAGPRAIPVLLDRLELTLSTGRGAASAWALARVVSPPTLEGAPAPVRDGLLRAVRSPSGDTRLAAASALGALEVAEAGPALLELAQDPALPESLRPAALLALAGVRGPDAGPLERRLRTGGGPAWAEGTLACFLRWGRPTWPLLVRALEESSATDVRAAAATLLLVLAEPAAACDLARIQGLEPEPVLRRVMLQALAAGRQADAWSVLDHLGRAEPDGDLRFVARSLADAWVPSGAPARRSGGGRTPPAALRELLERPARARTWAELEAWAGPDDVMLLDRVARRLPLREDASWVDDHARLAQMRARLTCLGDPDCRRVGTRPGRLAP